MDGVSGPGVGSARSVVQEAGLVGIIMFGVADEALVGSAADGAQEVMRMERIKARGRERDETFCMYDSVCCRGFTHLIAS